MFGTGADKVEVICAFETYSQKYWIIYDWEAKDIGFGFIATSITFSSLNPSPAFDWPSKLNSIKVIAPPGSSSYILAGVGESFFLRD